MSTSQSTSEPTVEGCRPIDATPVAIDAEQIEERSTPELRELKTELRNDGLVPAVVTVSTRFAEDCSLSTQATVDDVRTLVDGAAFLGADTVVLTVEEAAAESKVRPALNACRERARREGVELEIEGGVSLS